MSKILFFMCFMNCYVHSSLHTPPSSSLTPVGDDRVTGTRDDLDAYFSDLLKEQREQAREKARVEREEEMMNNGQEPVACRLFLDNE